MQVSIGLVRPAWIKSSSPCVSTYIESTSTKGSSPRAESMQVFAQLCIKGSSRVQGAYGLAGRLCGVAVSSAPHVGSSRYPTRVIPASSPKNIQFPALR